MDILNTFPSIFHCKSRTSSNSASEAFLFKNMCLKYIRADVYKQ